MTRAGAVLAGKLYRGVLGLVALSAVLALPSVSLEVEKAPLLVAKDQALSIDEYAALGVPDPRAPWTASDYETALRILEEIPRVELPRAGGASRLLFDRLLISYANAFELPVGDPPKPIEGEGDLPRSLSTLYSQENPDSLLFDLEIIEIRANTLARTISLLPPREESLAQALEFAKFVEAADSDSDRVRFSEGMKRAERFAGLTSAQVRHEVSDLVAVASIPEIRLTARELLLARLRDIAPDLPLFLGPDDVSWVATLLRGCAGSALNASIASGLSQIATDLELVGEIDGSGSQGDTPDLYKVDPDILNLP